MYFLAGIERARPISCCLVPNHPRKRPDNAIWNFKPSCSNSNRFKFSLCYHFHTDDNWFSSLHTTEKHHGPDHVGPIRREGGLSLTRSLHVRGPNHAAGNVSGNYAQSRFLQHIRWKSPRSGRSPAQNEPFRPEEAQRSSTWQKPTPWNATWSSWRDTSRNSSKCPGTLEEELAKFVEKKKRIAETLTRMRDNLCKVQGFNCKTFELRGEAVVRDTVRDQWLVKGEMLETMEELIREGIKRG